MAATIPPAPSDVFAGAVQAEYEALVRRIADLRGRADTLQRLASRAARQAEEEECYLDELEGLLGIAPQLRLEAANRRLRGERLREVAVAILRERPPGEEIHYTEWFALLRAAGHHVGGKDPLATFLAQVSRAPDVERVAPRSGLYRLRAA